MRNTATMISTAENPIAVFEYPFKHRTVGPLKKLKILSKFLIYYENILLLEDYIIIPKLYNYFLIFIEPD